MDDNRDQNTIFVLFGATGDLAWRKIVPALFRLFCNTKLPQRFLLLCVGRQSMTERALSERFKESAAARAHGTFSNDDWQRFSEQIRYLSADVSIQKTYADLAQFIHQQEQQWTQTSQLLFYFSMPSTFFSPIVEGLGGAKLNRNDAVVVVEKPIGHDLQSFRDIDNTLKRFFTEEQIFRIDHFLGKETVQNIFAMRFGNPIFEPIWNRRYVDHVAITVAETLGVERRASYYEHAGALRDMLQNHLLQLLCLIAIEPPVVYDASDIRNRKMDVMSAIRPFNKETLDQRAIRGQYDKGRIGGAEVPSYRDDLDVAPASTTETFAAVKLFIDNWRWQDVAFYLRTGKRMAASVSEISVRFRDVPHCAFPVCFGLNSQPVRLIIQIQPQEGIVLKFMAKEPGSLMTLKPVDMRFSYKESFNIATPDAYETLLWDALRGDATLFMRADQVEAAWQLFAPVLTAWSETPPNDFPNYAAGSWGPESSDELIHSDKRQWLIPD